MVQQYEWETLIDSVVNAIPVAILVLFGAVFTVTSPWGSFSLETALQLGNLAIAALSVVAITYWVRKLIAAAEARSEDHHSGYDSR